MDDQIYNNFFEALNEIVNEEVPVRSKTDALLAAMDEQDKRNLNELLSWDIDLED